MKRCIRSLLSVALLACALSAAGCIDTGPSLASVNSSRYLALNNRWDENTYNEYDDIIPSHYFAKRSLMRPHGGW